MMKRDELYAKYIGVMNINAVLKQKNAELLEALRTLVNNIPIPEIELARSAWGNTNTTCILEARAKAVEAIAQAEGKT